MGSFGELRVLEFAMSWLLKIRLIGYADVAKDRSQGMRIMGTDTKLSPAEIREAATRAIIREVGLVGYIRFMQDLAPGQGDYTRDRWNFLPKAKPIEEWIEEIKETEKALGLDKPPVS
jgi:hypothetical protein